MTAAGFGSPGRNRDAPIAFPVQSVADTLQYGAGHDTEFCKRSHPLAARGRRALILQGCSSHPRCFPARRTPRRSAMHPRRRVFSVRRRRRRTDRFGADRRRRWQRSGMPEQLRRAVVRLDTREPRHRHHRYRKHHALLCTRAGSRHSLRCRVGRQGFTWAGVQTIAARPMAGLRTAAQMIARQPYLPRFMAGGPGNPLGARAMYSAPANIASTVPTIPRPSASLSPAAVFVSPMKTLPTCQPRQCRHQGGGAGRRTGRT